MNNKGLSPIVAVTILIAITMAIAGVLTAGITGSEQTETKKTRIEIEGLTEQENHLILRVNGGKSLKDAYSFENNGSKKDNIIWEDMELRVGGIRPKAKAIRATDGGKLENLTDTDTSKNDFCLGDELELELYNPLPKTGEKVVVLWIPNSQQLAIEEV